jgi:dipeptidyl aminopeptidase/acylaminoacyl peptidase
VWEANVVRWTPDSSKIVLTLVPESIEIKTESPLNSTSSEELKKNASLTVTVYSYSPADKIDPERERAARNNYLKLRNTDLSTIDASSGKVQRLVREINPETWWISPEGSSVAFANQKGFESGDTIQHVYDIATAPLSGGMPRVLASNVRSSGPLNLSWSPNGQALAYVTSGPLAQGDCFVVNLKTGESRNLTTGQHPPFNASTLRAPLWTTDSKGLYLLTTNSVWRVSAESGDPVEVATIPERLIKDIVGANDGGDYLSADDGRSVMVLTLDNRTKHEGIYRIDLVKGTYTKIIEDARSYADLPFYKLDVSSDGSRAIYVTQSANRCENIWLLNSKEKIPKQITNINPHLDRYQLGESQLITWRNLNSQTLYGALLLPAGYEHGKRYPVIVSQYPGAFLSDRVNLFGLTNLAGGVENFQLLASRGYAVFLPDVPAKAETYMRDIASAVLSGVDKLIDLGIADPERLGVTGLSNGGYGVLSLLVQTTRFKAAVERAGTANLVSAFTQMLDDGSSIHRGGAIYRSGSLWEKRELYIENSPLFYLDRVQTPLLIIQGTADLQIQSFISDEVFVSLRYLGKEVQYARYRGESHGPADWSYANQLDYLERMISWFDTQLRPAVSQTVTQQ